MKQLWAVVCIVGFAAFLIYGFIVVQGGVGDRPAGAVDFVACLVGFGIGLVGWTRVARFAPKMHGRRAAARARLDEEYSKSMS